MQFVQYLMASRLFQSIANNEDYSRKPELLKHVLDAGSGDFDYEKALILLNSENSSTVSKYQPIDNCLYKQAQNIQNSLRSLEVETSTVKEDISSLRQQITRNEDTFHHKNDERYGLKEACEDHVGTIDMILSKNRRMSERVDKEIRQLDLRIQSWQCIIDRAKEVQIQEADMFE